MSTRLIHSCQNIITDEMVDLSKIEKIEAELIRQKIFEGKAAILKNKTRQNLSPVIIGDGIKTKIAACLSGIHNDEAIELLPDKLRVIEQAGADILIDDSLFKFDDIRQILLSKSKLPLGTFPLYQTCFETLAESNDICYLTKERVFSDIEKHCADGVDFIFANCGVTKFTFEKYIAQQRLLNIPSRGGIILGSYIKSTGRENPMYEYFDELLEILKYYDATLCLSAAFQPYSTIDANDRIQQLEMNILGELAVRARKSGVQVIVEGVGYAPVNVLSSVVQNTKEMCDYAPLLALNLSATDCAKGYENFASALAGVVASHYGINVLSCLCDFNSGNPMNSAQIRDGIMMAKIAAHCSDLAVGNKEAVDKNIKMSVAKANFDVKRQMENVIDKDVFETIDLSMRDNDFTFNLLKRYFN